MTTIMSHPDKHGLRSRKGFTLTEILIVMTISVFLSGVIFSAFGFVTRSSFAIANYADMTSEGRRGLEIFARDVREARDVVDFSDTSLTLRLVELQSGVPVDVVYRYDPDAAVFTREVDGNSQVLMRAVQDDFRFSRFNLLQEEASSHAETKQIHLQLSMTRRVIARETTENVISARYIMRNKSVTQ